MKNRRADNILTAFFQLTLENSLYVLAAGAGAKAETEVARRRDAATENFIVKYIVTKRYP